ncbi:hypothetical protein DWY40_04470 [Ruminococcus sp. AF25-17]|mgnify:CR=1 FL=1|jgi:hypothetical protein|nr:hypothetical protein DWY40_04470 [Ruminococcus sp. AF25-17]
MKKKINRVVVFFAITAICSIVGLILSILSYFTGYYVLGEMNSIWMFIAIGTAILVQIVNFILNIKIKNEWIFTILNAFISILMIISFALLIGDRVEGIGFTIVTQFDAGHGGAEACYLSFGACGAWLLGSILKIVESFLKTPSEKRLSSQN